MDPCAKRTVEALMKVAEKVCRDAALYPATGPRERSSVVGSATSTPTSASRSSARSATKAEFLLRHPHMGVTAGVVTVLPEAEEDRPVYPAGLPGCGSC